MKKNRIISIALIGAFALLTAACVKEITSNEELYRPAGSRIVFSAATGYDNGVPTRAVYSGEVFGTQTGFGNSNSRERIDWEANDPVKIVYNNTAKPYHITGTPTAENELSKASLDGTLEWDGSGNHLFYALYPAGETGAGALTTAGVVTGSIPSTQNVTSLKLNVTETIGGTSYTYDKFQPDTRHYGFLVARETVEASSTSSEVFLKFKPAFTTFEFKFKSAGSDYPKLMSATLATESVDGTTPAIPLAGNFEIKLTGTDDRGATWNTATTGDNPTRLYSTTDCSLSNAITVGFGTSGIAIPADNILDFSVLCLPIELKGVKLTLTFEGGLEKVLRFKDNSADPATWYTFAAARKYVITNVTPSLEWTYVIEPIDDIEFVGHNAVSNIGFNVKSYKYLTSNPSYKVEVPWHIEYSANGTSYGTTGGHADFMLSGLPDSATGVGSYTDGEDRASNIIRPNSNHSDAYSDADEISKEALKNAHIKGSSSAPFDLSTHDVNGDEHAQTTANSYVVSAPGWYKFPVVYGNAITNGVDNKTAYDPYASGSALKDHWDWVWGTYDASHHDVYMTEHFYNALNQPITSPYVLVDVPASNPKAVLVWQDTDEGKEIIKYGADDLKLTGSGSNAYIEFYIAPENIRQGNVVLAVRDGNGGADKEVLWSWQIWVSEKDLNPITSKDLMPYNLGWVDKSGVTVQNYTDRINYYRIVQDETGGDTEDFYIKQIGDQNAIPNNNGYNTFYQWGRKDPITSAKLSGRTSSEYSDQLSAWPVERIYQFPSTLPLYPEWNPPADGDYHSPSYSYGIKHPWIPLNDPENNGWVNGQFYPPYEQFLHTDFLRGSRPNPYEAGVAHNGAQFRKMSGCPFNLWNSYAYSSADFSEHKYKTVYDPCPPGFCVPSLGTFASIESATLERDPGNGINVIYSNGDAFFLPFSGSRGTRQVGTEIHFLVNDWGVRGVYWVDAPSAVNKSNAWDTITANHGGGWWWYQFAKSLHAYNNIGSFPDEIDHTHYIKYSPEIGHWGAQPQAQKVGFDDVRSNAFSVRPVVDPMY